VPVVRPLVVPVVRPLVVPLAGASKLVEWVVDDIRGARW